MSCSHPDLILVSPREEHISHISSVKYKALHLNKPLPEVRTYHFFFSYRINIVPQGHNRDRILNDWEYMDKTFFFPSPKT